MKSIKHIFVLLDAIALTLTASAGEPRKGYRGFADLNGDMGFPQDYYGNNSVTVYYGVSTSHGYQFDEHYFLGAGVMWERYHHSSYSEFHGFPVYIHARTDWTFGKFPLYGDVRIGGVIFGDYRLYLSPTVGYRLDVGRKININFGIGMNFRGYGWSDEKTLHPQLAVRVGIDF